MAARLLPTLELGTDETPTSFVSRLARLHNINSASTIATDLGIDYRQLIDGDCEQLRRLSQLSAASQDTLDLPLNFHPAAIRASAGFTPSGAGGAMCGRPGWSGLPGRPRIAMRLAA